MRGLSPRGHGRRLANCFALLLRPKKSACLMTRATRSDRSAGGFDLCCGAEKRRQDAGATSARLPFAELQELRQGDVIASRAGYPRDEKQTRARLIVFHRRPQICTDFFCNFVDGEFEKIYLAPQIEPGSTEAKRFSSKVARV